MSAALRVGLLGEAAHRNADRLAVRVAGDLSTVLLEGPDDPALETVHALVSRTLPRRACPQLRLLQLPSAGTETIDLDRVPAEATVCNAAGHEVAMAEYVVGSLALAIRGLFAAASLFGHDHAVVEDRSRWGLERELGQCRVTILGAGGVALATATRLAGLGTAVVVCSRREPAVLPPLVTWRPAAELGSACRAADALVIACPLTPATQGLVGLELLAQLHRGVLVNVSRAAIVRTPDLLAALQSGALSGAVLDVWDGVAQEDATRLARLPGVWMTPHLSAWTTATMERRWAGIAANLEAFAAGRPLRNVVRAAAISSPG